MAFELPPATASDALLDAIGLWQRLEQAGCSASHHTSACTHACPAEPWASTQPAPEGDAAMVGLQLAAALERTHQRGAAIAALERACARRPLDARARLALAKLLFRSGAKAEALASLQHLLQATRAAAAGASSSSSSSSALPPLEHYGAPLASDAWYLAGWACIHADDHTAAYALWREGALLLPSDARLARQHRKLQAWAGLCEGEAAAGASPLVGAGGLVTDAALHVTRHALPPSDPAHALFAPSQAGYLAHTSTLPVLTREECRRVCAILDAHIAAPPHHGVWPTVRSASLPTTDIAVEEVPQLVPWLRALLRTRLLPMLALCYPRLADGSALTPQRLRIHDAFLVRYDAALGSVSLPLHSDTSALSITLPLTQVGVDFEGGGLLLEALCASASRGVLNAGAGEVMAFAGPLRHGGGVVTAGVRTVLVLFLYVEGFAYGGLLGHAGGGGKAGGGREGASREYVVYRETLALAQALRVEEEEEE